MGRGSTNSLAMADSARSWTQFPCDVSGHTIRIFQWNILADALAVTTNSVSGKQETSFTKTPLQCLQWSYRLPLILQEIKNCKPDIICLQEVDRLPDIIIDGYDGMFLPKVDSPCCKFTPNNGPDGCAILYNTSTVSVADRKDLILRDKLSRPTNQVAILAKFDLPAGNGSFCVGTTHLKSKGGFEALRLAQGSDLLTQMITFSNGDPFVISGDFNAVPSESVCCAYRSNVVGESGGTIKSAYGKYSSTDEDPPFTTVKYRANGLSKYTGDYIWYDSSQLKVIKLYDLLTELKIGDNGLPSATYPSDHMSLCADLTIIKRCNQIGYVI